MGRKSTIEKNPEWAQEIRTEYVTHKKPIKEIAGIYKLSQKTVRKILKGMGVQLKRGAPKGTVRPPFHSSCLAEWVRKNPGVILPRKVAKIAELTGCPPNSVKTYLYRRRKEVRDVVKGIDFPNLYFVLTDREGKRFPTMAMRTCSAKVDPYTFDIHLTGDKKPSGFFSITISFSKLQEITQTLSDLSEPR